MIPDLITAKITAIACVICLAIGAGGGAVGAHLFYAPRLELAATKLQQAGEKIQALGVTLDDQSKAIANLVKYGDERAAAAEAATKIAAKARAQADASAQALLLAQPEPGQDRCTAASALVRKELGR